MNKRWLIVFIVPFASLLLSVFSPDVRAQSFMEGKSIYLLGATPGGGYDMEARLIARHLHRFLSAKPRQILVQNMPGGRGMIQLIHFYNTAKPDGLTLIVSGGGQIGEQVLQEKVKFDFTKMPLIHAHPQSQIFMVHRHLGVRTPEDLLRVDPSKVFVPGSHVESGSFLIAILGLEVLGAKGYRWALGYPGTAPIMAAMERGEANAFATGQHHVIGKGGIFYEQVQDGTVIPLWQFGIMSKGNVIRLPGTQIPLFTEVYERLYGKPPSGPAWEALRLFGPMIYTTGRVLALPPGTPSERVEFLRQIFRRLYQDPQFSEEYLKVFGERPDPVLGEEADMVVKEMMQPGPGVHYVRELISKMR